MWHCEEREHVVYQLYPGKECQIDLHQCPLALLDSGINRVFRFYNYWTQNRIPDALSLPAQLVEAFDIIDGYTQKIKDKK